MSDGAHDNPYACLKPARQLEAEQELEFIDKLLPILATHKMSLHAGGLHYFIDHDTDLKNEIIKSLRVKRSTLMMIRDGAR